ncbi:hypothetical protein SASPL_106436 [Salvia splendens]|uniref:TF-B3 domain-containing protein n=1 Tax=Salvia splendens TaxID=180675 RepID=A0A8X8YSG9_SALSN|nr:hypothetical protein SASPL_106436 [Salvia splendens]
MVMAKTKYEAVRQQRLEENKKRMEELHLPLLTQAFKDASSPKSSPVLSLSLTRTHCISLILTTSALFPKTTEQLTEGGISRDIAMKKGEEVESSLGIREGLYRDFCRRRLPRNDSVVQLVDEQGEEWLVVYLSRKTGLSGGWKKFAVDHSLVDGDALVFQLVKPTVFKVFITRVDGEM